MVAARITSSPTAAEIVDVSYYEIEEKSGDSRNKYQARFMSAGQPMSTAPLKALFKSPGPSTVLDRPIIDYEDMLNNMLHQWVARHPRLTTQARGSKIFPLGDFPAHDAPKSKELGGGLVAVRGYLSAAKIVQGGLLFNMMTTCSAQYLEGPMMRLITTWQKDHRGASLSQLSDFLNKVKVRPRFGNSTRVKRVYALGRLPAGKTMFLCDKDPKTEAPLGREVSVQWWFSQAYGLSVPADDFVLDVGALKTPHKPVFWPASFSEVLPGQPYRGLLPLPSQSDAMIRHACMSPAQNKSLIESEGMDMHGVARIQGTRAGILQGTSFKMQTSMIELQGRRLPSPTVIFKNKTFKDCSSGKWNISNTTFLAPPKSDRAAFTVICLKQSKEPDIKNGKEFGAALTSEIPKRGGPSVKPIAVEGVGQSVNWPEKEDPVAYLTKLFSHCGSKGVRYCFLILSARAWYFLVKIAANAVGMQTTITMRQKDGTVKADNMFLANLLLKWNVKAGGVNGTVSPQDFKKIVGPETMLLGLDVVHPGPGALDGAPSIAGLVHSMSGSRPGEFLPVVQCQTPQPGKKAKEIVDRIDSMVVVALQRWQGRNGKLPRAILMTRDGVSDQQLGELLHTELPGIRRAINTVYQGTPKVLIYMFATQKRHPVRFFKLGSDKSPAFDDKGNPLPGLICDTQIVSRTAEQWYCTAHKCLQGTSRPCRHCVIVDEFNLSKDKQQQLLLNLSFIYPRSTTSTSLPAPAKLADLLCEKAKVLAHDVFVPTEAQRLNRANYDPNVHFRGQDSIHPRLRDTPWFI